MFSDSMIYVQQMGDKEVPGQSNFLGGLKDELDGDRCSEYFSTGPKSYGMKIHKRISPGIFGNGEWKVKIKGFRLNYSTRMVLNAETMLEKLLCTGDNTLRTIDVHEKNVIRRNKALAKLFSKDITKRWQVLVTKRVRRGLETLPYGYDTL